MPNTVQGQQQKHWADNMKNPFDEFDTAQSNPFDEFDAQEPSAARNYGKPADIAAGALRGAASIGSTILAPFKAAFEGTGQTGAQSERGRILKEVEQGLQYFGADPESMAYGAGKIGAEIAGTSGVGGVLAKGATGLGNAIPALAPYAPKIAAALESGGFRINPAGFVGPMPAATIASRVGDALTRAGAGAAVGGAAAGMVDPESADTGAMIGAAIPGGIKVAGALGSGIKNAAGGLTQNILGMTTGAGKESIKGAYEAGKSGAQKFVDNMRGNSAMGDVVDSAKTGLNNMRQQMYQRYSQAKGGWAADTTPLDMRPIVDAYTDATAKFGFKGTMRPGVSEVQQQVEEKLVDWIQKGQADPEFLMVKGLDELKQQLAAITPKDLTNRQGRKFVTSVVDAVKDGIIKQRPEYAKAMKDYWQSSNQLDEIERTLSLGDKPTMDTAMRKIQSLMRNNVNTNYGNRLDLARELEQQGGEEFLPAVAGQALNSWTPRGLQAVASTGAGLYGLLNPALLTALPLGSPRLMGEAAYGAGRLSGRAGMTLRDLLNNAALSGGGAQQLNAPAMQSMATIVPSLAFSR